jgi:hypothetical protein
VGLALHPCRHCQPVRSGFLTSLFRFIRFARLAVRSIPSPPRPASDGCLSAILHHSSLTSAPGLSSIVICPSLLALAACWSLLCTFLGFSVAHGVAPPLSLVGVRASNGTVLVPHCTAIETPGRIRWENKKSVRPADGVLETGRGRAGVLFSVLLFSDLPSLICK